MAIEAALSGQGIAMGRLSLVEELLKAGRLVAPFRRRVKSPTRYFLVYPEELENRPGVRTVAEWLREEAKRTTVAASSASAPPRARAMLE
jgi:DNA-binding transcriptional LysR family regulator